MKRLVEGATARLKGLRLTSVVRIVTCVVGANAAAVLGQHFPLLAGVNSGALDPNSIAIQIATAFVGSLLLAILAGVFSTLRRTPYSARASISLQGIAVK
jgi:Na+/proline symporter